MNSTTKLSIMLAVTLGPIASAQTYTVLKSFNGTAGDAPAAGLAVGEGTLYGTTENGDVPPPTGWAGFGTVFKVNTDGSGFALLRSFTGSDGGAPLAAPLLADRTLYGTTTGGGSFYSSNSPGCGVIFKVNTDGSGYAVVKELTGTWDGLFPTDAWDGLFPYGNLVLSGTTLYGTTQQGGDYGAGVVFSLADLPTTSPSITTPPFPQTAEVGSVAFLSVEVTNTPPASTYYQWYFSGTDALAGATNSYVGVTNIQPAQAGAYTVVVTNFVGAVTSAPALLSVIPPVERRVVPAVGLPAGTGMVILHERGPEQRAATLL